MNGHVSGLKAATSDELAAYIGLDGPLPGGASVGIGVEATIDIEKIDNVFYIGRPAAVPANSEPNVSASLFKIDADGKGAERVTVKFGRLSVNTIEVLSGLKEDDKIILSDMSSVDSAELIRLTDQRHLAMAQSVPAQDTAETREAARARQASSPSCRYCPNPEYPEEARRAKIPSAAVLLEVTVLETGDVDAQSVRVTKGLCKN